MELKERKERCRAMIAALEADIAWLEQASLKDQADKKPDDAENSEASKYTAAWAIKILRKNIKAYKWISRQLV
jgi:hypothetical protein